MPVELTFEIKKEIAGYLDSEMKCFYHIATAKLEWYPDELKHSYMDAGEWKDVIKKVNKNLKQYIFFEGWKAMNRLE